MSFDREYRYRRLFPGLTHDQYLDEPEDVISWLLHIHDLRERARGERRAPDADPGVA